MRLRITWTRFADGTWLCDQHPVRIPSRADRSLPVCVEVPGERDTNFDDGWHWYTIQSRPDRELLVLGSIAQAKAFVADNLMWLLDQVADDYDGDPAEATAQRAETLLAVRKRYEPPAEPTPRREPSRSNLGSALRHPETCAWDTGGKVCGKPAVAVRAGDGRDDCPVCAGHVADGEMVPLADLLGRRRRSNHG